MQNVSGVERTLVLVLLGSRMCWVVAGLAHLLLGSLWPWLFFPGMFGLDSSALDS